MRSLRKPLTSPRRPVVRTSGIVVAGFAAVLVSACASVPSLEGATGTAESNILVRDIVRQVKCEISDAFDAKVEDRRFYWLQNWTAKVDLTLMINEQAGLSPSVSYTKFFPNAFNFDAGSSSLTSKVISPVAQFFTLSAGANLSEQAQRSETITFSLSLKELKVWRKRLRSAAARSGTRIEELICDPHGLELRGRLGLQEWIELALYPVEGLELQAGEHPSPLGPSKPPGPSARGQPTERLLPQDLSLAEAQRRVLQAATAARSSASKARQFQQDIGGLVSTLETYVQSNASFFPVLTDELKTLIPRYVANVKTAHEYARQDAENAEEAVKTIEKINSEVDAAVRARAGGFSATRVEDAKSAANDAKKFENDAGKQKRLASSMAQKFPSLNPPVDGLLHSVQFVVAYGASVAPNWTLLQWKGPSLTVPGASASGVRTHILNIALGPTAEQNWLIQNQTVINAFHP